jgi:uncharacterized coiled-coil protein SlyX
LKFEPNEITLEELRLIVKEQNEYIVELEMEIAELTDRWQYLKEELDEIKSQRLEEELES